MAPRSSPATWLGPRGLACLPTARRPFLHRNRPGSGLLVGTSILPLVSSDCHAWCLRHEFSGRAVCGLILGADVETLGATSSGTSRDRQDLESLWAPQSPCHRLVHSPTTQTPEGQLGDGHVCTSGSAPMAETHRAHAFISLFCSPRPSPLLHRGVRWGSRLAWQPRALAGQMSWSPIGEPGSGAPALGRQLPAGTWLCLLLTQATTWPAVLTHCFGPAEPRPLCGQGCAGVVPPSCLCLAVVSRASSYRLRSLGGQSPRTTFLPRKALWGGDGVHMATGRSSGPRKGCPAGHSALSNPGCRGAGSSAQPCCIVGGVWLGRLQSADSARQGW